MQRFINNPDLVVDDTVRGFVKAHSDLVKLADNPRVVAYAQAPIRGKVGVVTGGGSGHEPAFIGYVGHNMLDAVAVGEIFSSPTAKSFHDAIKIADGGRGVVCLYGNYAGDNMNVKMAIKLAAKDGVEVLTVVANDDVCSAPPSEREKRRGVAGEILMWKIGGAKAALGGSLEEVRAAAQKAIDNCRSIGVGLGPLHAAGGRPPQFHDRAGQDGGRHRPPRRAGNAGRASEDGGGSGARHDQGRARRSRPARRDGSRGARSRASARRRPTSSTSSTTPSRRKFAPAALKVARTFVGNFFTSLEMVGATLTIMALDGELKELLAVDVACPAPL